MSEALEDAREAYERQAWKDAHARFVTIDEADALEPQDLERLATASYLVGLEDEATDAWARAHAAFVERSEIQRAVRCTFWLTFVLMNRGEMAPAAGWLARGERLLDGGPDCVEQGYLLLPSAIQNMYGGDPDEAHSTFRDAAAIGERFRDANVVTIARLGQGQTSFMMGEASAAMAAFDEVMVGVTAGEPSPIVAGIAYCAVIEACHDAFDVRRAQEWTAALGRWCASQPDLVPYRGQCLVHRAQISQLRGAWGDATEEAQRACEWLADPPGQPAIGMAFYQRGELHRLVGESGEAEDAYRRANSYGHPPQPGLALLRLEQGQTEAARASIGRAVGEAEDPAAKARVLPSYVDVMLAVGDVAAAGDAADELSAVAAQLDAPLLVAVAEQAQASVLLVRGDAPAALVLLRRAWKTWQDFDAPYEAARVRVLLGRTYRALGDEDSADLELDGARRMFQDLGAAPDIAHVDSLLETTPPSAAGGLTSREVEVLGLVATGRTNRAIADTLVISEKTVARHVSNIFTKIGVSSRAAATAYAYEHELV